MASVSWGHDMDTADTEDDRVVFREAGDPTLHQGSGLHLDSDYVRFETSYGVAPGMRLSLTMTAFAYDESRREVSMEVLSVDARPSGDFTVAGRLQRDR